MGEEQRELSTHGSGGSDAEHGMAVMGSRGPWDILRRQRLRSWLGDLRQWLQPQEAGLSGERGHTEKDQALRPWP